jgi:hypothetical protein
VLVIGVDGVRFDLLGPEVTPVIWGFRLGRVPGAGRHRRGHADLVRPLLGDHRHRHRGGRARHLTVQTYTQFTDHSGRSNYVSTDTFIRI